ncbi:Sugar-specific transcriptional regulator TrmB [Halorubrum xinjiangense]|uniref:Sugar-specific transcriptional regulator TrmB n=1 Tax=Halorubrum xinjiangense TaxID=261291 RepID=A0A1G7JQ10_9EURY|nr:helix-turn-helix domain-containing protein [Halorubrum xinjiangense]SDF27003.1 Sugar-specific transcriptional regulator TrmB [Halorubrum xinjiangense]
MSKATAGPERAVSGLLSVARLLEEPRLARLYSFVLREGEVTIDEITDELEIPRTTAYSDTGTLVELSVLARDDDQKTHTYSAVPITLTATLDGDEYTVTPTLVDAFGRSPHDRDLDLLVEKYGLGKLAAALTYAVPYANGNMSERVAARELDLQYAFGVAVLQALRDVVHEMESVDPHFEDIRDAREYPPATED